MIFVGKIINWALSAVLILFLIQISLSYFGQNQAENPGDSNSAVDGKPKGVFPSIQDFLFGGEEEVEAVIEPPKTMFQKCKSVLWDTPINGTKEHVSTFISPYALAILGITLMLWSVKCSIYPLLLNRKLEILGSIQIFSRKIFIRINGGDVLAFAFASFAVLFYQNSQPWGAALYASIAGFILGAGIGDYATLIGFVGPPITVVCIKLYRLYSRYRKLEDEVNSRDVRR